MPLTALPDRTQRYDQVLALVKEETQLLNKISVWTQRYDRTILAKHSGKINEIFQNALFLQRQSHKMLGKIDFGYDYLNAQSVGLEQAIQEKYSATLNEMADADRLIGKVAATLTHLAHAPGEQNEKLDFQPSAPWFYQKWAANVSKAVTTVAAPFKATAEFAIQHPFATIAAAAGMTAASSYFTCAPSSLSALIQPMDSCPDTTRLSGMAAAAISAGAIGLGLSEPVATAATNVKDGLFFAYNRPGKALLNTGKALVWDGPRAAVHYTNKAATNVFNTAKHGHLIGPALGLVTTAITGNVQAGAMIAGAGLAMKGLHAATTPPPVVLD